MKTRLVAVAIACPGARARRRGWHLLRQQAHRGGRFFRLRAGALRRARVEAGHIRVHRSRQSGLEQWVYDFDSRQPLRFLTIVGGRVTRIEDSSRSR
jgi:hypothetical protein